MTLNTMILYFMKMCLNIKWFDHKAFFTCAIQLFKDVLFVCLLELS